MWVSFAYLSVPAPPKNVDMTYGHRTGEIPDELRVSAKRKNLWYLIQGFLHNHRIPTDLRILPISYTGKRKKKVTHIEVKEDKLDEMLKSGDRPGQAQFALF
jgi:hypothetical protein